MKYLFCTALSFLFSSAVFGQPETLANMVRTPKATLDHDYLRDKDTNITVSSHYAAKYVESNYQYRQYLNYLIENKKDSLLAIAQPNTEIWKDTKLKNHEKEYLKQHYWVDKIFDGYPVLGLDYYQIDNYLRWKTKILNGAYQLFLGNINLEYLESNEFDIIKELKADPEKWKKLGFFPFLRLPIFHELAVSHQFGGRQSHVNDIDKPFSKWLSENKKFRFLVYEPEPYLLVSPSIHKKLNKLGIVPVTYSNINNRRDDVNYRQYEMVLYWASFLKDMPEKNIVLVDREDRSLDGIEKEIKKGFKIIYLDRDEMLSVNFTYKNKKIRKAKLKQIGMNPFFAFRTCMTRIGGITRTLK